MRREEQLAVAYTNRLDAIRRAAGTRIVRAWRLTATPSDPQPFVETALPIAQAAVTAATQLVDGYLALMFTELGEPAQPQGVDLDLDTLRDGSTAIETYARPTKELRRQLGEGALYVQAQRVAQLRAAAIVETDVALAHRRAAVDIMSGNDAVVGYRRVLTGQSCVLCATASTQRYHTGELMPIHDHCDCGVAPIIGDRDPGHVINQDLVNRFRDEANRPDYWNDRNLELTDDGRIVRRGEDGTETVPSEIVDHGEKGPILTFAEHDTLVL